MFLWTHLQLTSFFSFISDIIIFMASQRFMSLILNSSHLSGTCVIGCLESFYFNTQCAVSCVDSMFLYVYIDLWNYIFKNLSYFIISNFMGVNIRETTCFPFFVPPLLSHYYHSHTTLLLTLMVTKRVEAFSHQAFVCDLSWMSYNSMQF